MQGAVGVTAGLGQQEQMRAFDIRIQGKAARIRAATYMAFKLLDSICFALLMNILSLISRVHNG
jgi:hypothetical protein